MLANGARNRWRTLRSGRVGAAFFVAGFSSLSLLTESGRSLAQEDNTTGDAQAPVNRQDEQEEEEESADTDESTESKAAESEETDEVAAAEEARAGQAAEPVEETEEESAEHSTEQSEPGQAASEPPTTGSPGASPEDDTPRLNTIVSVAPAGQPIPFDRQAPERDPRERALDTSDSVYQPEAFEPSPDMAELGEDEAARRTRARTLGHVTVLTNAPTVAANATDALEANDVLGARELEPVALDELSAANRSPTAIEAQQLPLRAARASSPTPTDGRWMWLWALAGAAVALLLPIVLLLTRPTRKG